MCIFMSCGSARARTVVYAFGRRHQRRRPVLVTTTTGKSKVPDVERAIPPVDSVSSIELELELSTNEAPDVADGYPFVEFGEFGEFGSWDSTIKFG